jgi:hypothetical protein
MYEFSFFSLAVTSEFVAGKLLPNSTRILAVSSAAKYQLLKQNIKHIQANNLSPALA